MSAVMAQRQQAAIEVIAQAQGQAQVLTPAALEFLAGLHRRFEPARQARLAARRERQAFFDAGGLPDFRPDTAAIRAGDWKVAPLPPALLDRRVEITGPVDPKMVINALNSGAKVYMADFEDSTSPDLGQPDRRPARADRRGRRHAGVHRRRCRRRARQALHACKPFDEQAVLMVRPRGWHLDEKHVLVDGMPISAGLFDLGLFAFHNADVLAAKDRGPYFYLPKLQSMEEARCGTRCSTTSKRELRLAAGPDQGHRADRDAAGRVRDGRDPACAARRASSASTAAAGITSFRYIKTFRTASRQGAAGARRR